jgi:hypothetical protein
MEAPELSPSIRWQLAGKGFKEAEARAARLWFASLHSGEWKGFASLYSSAVQWNLISLYSELHGKPLRIACSLRSAQLNCTDVCT